MNDLTLREAKLIDRALEGYATDPHRLDWELDTVASLRAELAEFLLAIEDEHRTLFLWTDGAARPTNPGPAGIGIVGKVAGRVVIEVAEYIGKTTNNVAEYKAAVEALRRAHDLGVSNVLLHTDSKLVYMQFLGRWQCKDENLKPLLGRMRGLALQFESCQIKWIPREQNREADGLSVAGAYRPRECGACRHPWHISFCTVTTNDPATAGIACGCPHGFKGGIEA